MTTSRTPSDVVARQIRTHRVERGWTARRLAMECAALGATQITPAVIANIETGRPDESTELRRRFVTIDELLVFAYALGVPPLLLIAPLGSNDKVPMTPNIALHPHLAWKVIAGREHLANSERKGMRMEESAPHRAAVYLFETLDAAQHRYQTAKTDRHFANLSGDPHRIDAIGPEYSDALKEFADAVEAILRMGLNVPAYTRDTVDALVATDLISYPDRLETYDD